MNAFWVSIIYSAVRALVGSGTFDRLAILVRELIDDNGMTNNEKKDAVKEYIRKEKSTISSIVRDGIIFAVRLRYENPGLRHE